MFIFIGQNKKKQTVGLRQHLYWANVCLCIAIQSCVHFDFLMFFFFISINIELFEYATIRVHQSYLPLSLELALNILAKCANFFWLPTNMLSFHCWFFFRCARVYSKLFDEFIFMCHLYSCNFSTLKHHKIQYAPFVSFQINNIHGLRLLLSSNVCTSSLFSVYMLVFLRCFVHLTEFFRCWLNYVYTIHPDHSKPVEYIACICGCMQ